VRRPTLRVRLFVSYAVVAGVGALALLLTIRVLAAWLFDHRVAGMGFGHGRAGESSALHGAFNSALNVSLAVAFAASLGTAAVAAVLVARRLLRPLDDVRAATRRLAAGDWSEAVRIPDEPELAVLAADVNALADSLAAGEQRRAALVGDVAHEMRTPLTTIRGYVDGVGDGVFAPGEALPAIRDELARLERLAADLASVSQAEEGSIGVHPAEIDLAELARVTAGRLAPGFDDARVELRIEGAAPLHVRADRERVAQILTNLLANARSYTPEGGRVTVSVRGNRDTATVTVADTGRGLRPADLERVFERFYRADPTGHAAGTGIGLTIARAVARAHGGDLVAASAGEGRGTTFTLTLPVAGPAFAA
jgi:signal transduction histidine kinase